MTCTKTVCTPGSDESCLKDQAEPVRGETVVITCTMTPQGAESNSLLPKEPELASGLLVLQLPWPGTGPAAP